MSSAATASTPDVPGLGAGIDAGAAVISREGSVVVVAGGSVVVVAGGSVVVVAGGSVVVVAGGSVGVVGGAVDEGTGDLDDSSAALATALPAWPEPAADTP